jgi:hypothetical protein
MRWFELMGVAVLASQLIAAGDPPTDEKKGPPFADGPGEEGKAAAATKPEVRNWGVTKDGYAYSFSMTPGVPDPGVVTEIMVVASSVPKTPHPKYGSRVPLDAARITLDLTNPAGELVGRYAAHAIPLASGKYGVHFTPSHQGLYTITLRGKTADGQEIAADLKLPVGVWPLPAELEGSGADAGKGGGRSVIKKPVSK